MARSGLVLAGANQRSSGTEDGWLTALEVSNLNLQGTELVVLSACETGLGKVVAGEGVYGLRRAFTLAGARSQLTSLWKVNDKGTKDLMVDYYRRLSQGKSRAEALREVQLAMLRGESKGDNGMSYQSPYFWGSFVPIGDWQPLRQQ
jgi:CHAT domain-containing protein